MKKRCEYCGRYYSGHKKQRFCSTKCNLALQRDKRINGSDSITTSVRISKTQRKFLDKMDLSASDVLRFGINRLRSEDRTTLFFIELRPLFFAGTLSMFFMFLGLFLKEYLLLLLFGCLIFIIGTGLYLLGGFAVDFLKLKFIG